VASNRGRFAGATQLSEARQLLAFWQLPIQQEPLHLQRARSSASVPVAHLLAAERPAEPDRLRPAYPLYLFIHDIADGDLVGWIDRRLELAARASGPKRLARMRAALIEPLKGVYGISDKVLMMALSQMLIGASDGREYWFEVGGSMIAVDTLVHNFLHRTGILHRLETAHAYGPACYRSGGCADVIEAVARRIDARRFNRAFPKSFPRFVQNAIWRYCSQQCLNICNGNRIDDRAQCENISCPLFKVCDRRPLYPD
jgi:hypothetical protein